MAYIVVENFSAGLDTRRHPLTSKSGTLQTLSNAHISRGGEIEKRKSFDALNVSLDAEPFQFPLYGLQSTSEKVYTFTESKSGDGVTVSEAPLGTNGVHVMYLKHPLYIFKDHEPFDEYSLFVYPEMDGIVSSTLYGGKTFVIAKWNNGEEIPFLDGKFISDFYIGETKEWMAVQPHPWKRFAETIAWQIRGETFGASTTGWGATVGALNPFEAFIDVTAPSGIDFTPSFVTDPLIRVETTVTQQFVDPVLAKAATGGFAISVGSPGTQAGGTRNLNAIGVTPNIMNIYFDEFEGIDEPGGWTGFKWDTEPVVGAGTGMGVGLAYNIDFHLKSMPMNRTGFSNTPVGGSIYSVVDRRFTADTGVISLGIPNTTGTYPDDHTANNGLKVEIEFDADPTGVPGIAELIDVATIGPGYVAGRFRATFCIMAGGVTNAVAKVLVDGVDIMGSKVKWSASNSATMANIVSKINSFTSTPDYTASLIDSKVKITTIQTGGAQKGRQIEIITEGDVAATGIESIKNGTDFVAGVPKIVRYTIGAVIL